MIRYDTILMGPNQGSGRFGYYFGYLTTRVRVVNSGPRNPLTSLVTTIIQHDSFNQRPALVVQMVVSGYALPSYGDRKGLDSKPSVTGSFVRFIAAYALKLKSQTGTEGLEMLSISRCLNH